jgi:ATP-dependent helicase HrpA
LEALLPRRFLDLITFERLPHLIRYLKAFLLRIDRATANPPRDRERAKLVQPYVEALEAMRREPAADERSQELEDFRWMVEEFRVSLFAQDLGTAMPVSAKRLDEALRRLRGELPLLKRIRFGRAGLTQAVRLMEQSACDS